MVRLKLCVELLDDRGVGTQETCPCRTLLRRELEPLLLVSCTCNHRWYSSRVAYAIQLRRGHSKASVYDVGTLDGKVASVTGGSRFAPEVG